MYSNVMSFALGSILISASGVVPVSAFQGKNAQSPAYNLPICISPILTSKNSDAVVEVFLRYTLLAVSSVYSLAVNKVYSA